MPVGKPVSQLLGSFQGRSGSGLAQPLTAARAESTSSRQTGRSRATNLVMRNPARPTLELRCSMMAAAPVAAGTAVEVLLGRHTSQLQRLGHVGVNGFLDLVQLLLSIQKTSRHGISEQCLPLFLKVRDFVAG